MRERVREEERGRAGERASVARDRKPSWTFSRLAGPVWAFVFPGVLPGLPCAHLRNGLSVGGALEGYSCTHAEGPPESLPIAVLFDV